MDLHGGPDHVLRETLTLPAGFADNTPLCWKQTREAAAGGKVFTPAGLVCTCPAVMPRLFAGPDQDCQVVINPRMTKPPMIEVMTAMPGPAIYWMFALSRLTASALSPAILRSMRSSATL